MPSPSHLGVDPAGDSPQRRRQTGRIGAASLRHIGSAAAFTADLLRDKIDQLTGLDAAHRDGWVDTILIASGLPLQPPQIEMFRRSP